MNKSVSNLLLACLAFAVVACATTRTDSMRDTSQRLEDRASEFYSQLRQDGDNRQRDKVSRDAQALAESARTLNRAVADRLPGDQVRIEYDRTARDYDRLHDELADAGYAELNRRVLEDFDRVTAAYRDVENAFGDRYARTPR